ncbi:MAG: ABC transporter ATP-binding protein [Thermomicrobiales bacterium]|jgi:oligopeptide/dipeptide ABC transporter ATP-binding protein|nr:ABC transporter ATP-binding protein [Thermomicrobiales bacterium]
MSATVNALLEVSASGAGPLLEVRDLVTSIKGRKQDLHAVDHVSFDVGKGEIFGVVGESGCGKSMTALSILRLIPANAAITNGSIQFSGTDLTRLSNGEMRKIRGNRISMVFQEPMTALDPSFTVGTQITEVIHAHSKVSKDEARERAARMLDRLGITNAASRLDSYPHQFSGGMRQRVMMALALVMNPELLIADEPTTALDVTIQAQILDLIAELRRDMGLSVLLITHNLGVVHEVADRVAVMYAGEIVEIGPVQQIFSNPQHPYTQGLLRSMPYLTERQDRLYVIPGRVPELRAMPTGCRFAARCRNRIDICTQQHPLLEENEPRHALRCFNPMPYVD